ncbi:MAG TPA: DUF6602 domain-containing protein [Armatimonadota bacterium]|nr:DUF6602 domain-containing protein [Armatimonadota bacterium]
MAIEFNELTQLCQALRDITPPQDVGSNLKGSAIEAAVRHYLRGLVPEQYEISSGRAITSFGAAKFSRECDVVIYDPRKSGPFPMVGFFPIEGVLAVIEVKTTLTEKGMREDVGKIRRVRSMEAYQGEYAEDRDKTGFGDNRPLGVVFAVTTANRSAKIAQWLQQAVASVELHQRPNFGMILPDRFVCYGTDYPMAGGAKRLRGRHMYPTEAQQILELRRPQTLFESFLPHGVEMRARCPTTFDIERYRACSEFKPLVDALACA